MTVPIPDTVRQAVEAFRAADAAGTECVEEARALIRAVQAHPTVLPKVQRDALDMMGNGGDGVVLAARALARWLP